MASPSTAKARKRTHESGRGPRYLLHCAASIATAYVSHNETTPEQFVDLLLSVQVAVQRLGLLPGPTVDAPVPPVPLSGTITPDYLISLEDGRRYRHLTGHLSARGMSPAQYRQKWGLSDDYPMVAPGYSLARSRSIKVKMSSDLTANVQPNTQRSRR